MRKAGAARRTLIPTLMSISLDLDRPNRPAAPTLRRARSRRRDLIGAIGQLRNRPLIGAPSEGSGPLVADQR